MGFKYDLRHYGLKVAWFNVRWNAAYAIAKFITCRNIRLSSHN